MVYLSAGVAPCAGACIASCPPPMFSPPTLLQARRKATSGLLEPKLNPAAVLSEAVSAHADRKAGLLVKGEKSRSSSRAEYFKVDGKACPALPRSDLKLLGVVLAAVTACCCLHTEGALTPAALCCAAAGPVLAWASLCSAPPHTVSLKHSFPVRAQVTPS